MADLSPYTVTIITKDDATNGFNVIPNAPIEIRERLANGSSGSLSLIYSDSTGATPITQTGATADSLGQFTFFAVAAQYNAVYDNNGTPVTIHVDTGVTNNTLSATIDRLNPATLAIAIADTTIQEGDALNVKERTTGNGGGAMWDVVLASTVTTNAYNIVACTGVPTLSLVLRNSTNAMALGFIGDGVVNNLAVAQFCVSNNIQPIFDAGTFLIDGTITGTGSAIWSGLDRYASIILGNNTNLFEIIGDVKLKNLQLKSFEAVVLGDNNTSLVKYQIEHCLFDDVRNEIKWQIAGTSAYPVGVGIDHLGYHDNRSINSRGVSLLTDTRIGSAFVSLNRWADAKYAPVWISVGGELRQEDVKDITVVDNQINGVTSASNTDTAAAGIVVMGNRGVIQGNIINDVSTTFGGNGVEVWGIYTKCRECIISNNDVSDVTNPSLTTNAVYVNIKGDPFVTTGEEDGYGVTCEANRLNQTIVSTSTGIQLFTDRIKCHNNTITGIANPLKHLGSADTNNNEITLNTCIAPVAGGTALDMRASGGTYKIQDNTFKGFTNGARFRTNATNIKLIDFLNNNILEGTGDALIFDDATAQGMEIEVMNMQGGSLSGLYAIRGNADNVRALFFEDVNIKNISQPLLFTGITIQEGRLSKFQGWELQTTDATLVNVLLLGLRDNTIITSSYSATGLSTDGLAYISKKSTDTFARIDVNPTSQLGTTTIHHDVKTGGDILGATSGNNYRIRCGGEAGKTTNIALDLDIIIKKTT